MIPPEFSNSSLCVVGNINRDIKLSPLHPGEHLFRDGETSVSSITETIGGGGANSACAASALGARTSFMGKIGADPLGQRLQHTLEQHQMSTHVASTTKHPTGSSIALSFDTGHRHFLSCLPASESLTFDDLNVAAIADHQHLLRGDIWFSESMLFAGNQKLFEAAKRAGVAVSIDLNWDPQWGRAAPDNIRARKDAVRAVLPWVTLAHGNIRELREFADADDLTTALHRITEWGAQAIVVHMGQKGGGYFHAGALIIEPPAPVAARVNTTGTGDVFSVCMMLLHQRHDLEIPQRLRIANRVVAEFMEGSRRLIPELL